MGPEAERAARADRVGELFERAVALPRAERRAYLDVECADDGALRTEIHSLLDSHDEAPEFLEGRPGRILARALASIASMPGGPVDEQVSARYQILERLGGGGMGVVYKARDLRLGRTVALKFLAPYLTADGMARERLVAEARAASVLDHPNIAAIHEIDQTESGQLYISMACYPGGTLRDRLAQGPLPVDAAVDVARQVADALAAAHAAGIIHRDIKPSNVLLASGGGVKLVDFGISTYEEAELPEDSRLLGTVGYMSPEHTRGEPLDRRSDIWSVGVLLYELLAGQRPFPGDDDHAVLQAIRDADPPPLGELRPEVPPALVHAVERCLRKERSRRWQSARELAAALLEIRPAGFRRESHGVTLGGPHPVAVLPFEDRALEPGRAWLSDALPQDLITRLSVVGGLRVTAWSSARTYAGAHRRLGDVALGLGVGSLIEGAVAPADDGRIRLSVSCVDGTTLASRWSETVELGLAEIPEVQARIASRVLETTGAGATESQRARLAAPGRGHPEAYVRYLEGLRHLDARDPADAGAALEHFRRLTADAPDCAQAWCGLAEAYQRMAGLLASPPDEAYPRAREAAERALELDDRLAEAHCAIALNLSYYHLDPRSAEHHFRRAIELAPSHAAAHGFYGELLRNQGRFDEALAEVRAAQLLNPRLPAHDLEEGIILYVARRYGQALERFDRLRETSPGFHMVFFFIALVQAQQGRYDEALQSLQILDPQGALPDSRSLRGYIYALTGRRADARAMITSLLASLDARASELDPSPFHAAVIHVALGEHDQALELLWEAFRQRNWQTALLGVEPMVDPLRTYPRFQALLETMGMHRTPEPFTPIGRPR